MWAARFLVNLGIGVHQKLFPGGLTSPCWLKKSVYTIRFFKLNFGVFHPMQLQPGSTESSLWSGKGPEDVLETATCIWVQ